MIQSDSIAVSPASLPQEQTVTTDTAVAGTAPMTHSESVSEDNLSGSVVETSVSDTLSSRAWGAVTPHTVARDSITNVSADTVRKEQSYGILLKAPIVPGVVPNETDSFGLSLVTGGLILLFCVIGIRFHNNSKYITTMLRNLIDVRIRTNVFDDTVRETSFMVLLNFLWSCSAGILLYGLLCATVTVNAAESFGIPGLHTHPALSMGICVGVGIVYTCFMALAYFMVGTVFAGKIKARLWLKGYTAGQGFLSFVYFFLALLLISHPEWGVEILWVAAGWLVLAKIVFIWKGFRIFFTQISSWVLFLYYLCSLEIVPLILTYLAAILLCGFLR